MSKHFHTDERETPDELFKPLHKEFNFDIDVCAMSSNTKLPRYWNIGHNALKQIWAPMRCFMNPPYSDIPTWLEKAKREAEQGALVVCILPVDTSTKWFHKYIWNGSWRTGITVRFPNKRYKFDNYANSAKFATMIVIFGKPI